jgi:hypothetical protein
VAIDSDSSISLPTAPPPRPAARRNAIEAALRKFDGVEEPHAVRAEKPWWATHRRQVGALATAAVVAVISVPLAITVLQNQPHPAPQAKAPAKIQHEPRTNFAAEPAPVQTAPANGGAVADLPRSKLPLEPHEDAPAAFAEEKMADNEAPTQALAVAAPPAAPPPPPAPAPSAPQRSEVADAQEIVTTGARVGRSTLDQRRVAAKASGTVAASASPQMAAYGKFLTALQSAVESGNKHAVSGLVAYPLRVKTSAGPRMYCDRKSVERDFEQIFTPKVRKAILAQQAEQLFVRDQGAMIGDGEVWFDQTCSNDRCSPDAPVRIKAVNP